MSKKTLLVVDDSPSIRLLIRTNLELSEFSVDEAIIAGATSVVFGQPVVSYLENFLGFPVGWDVPFGQYDRGKAAWVASQNGRVIKILGVSAGAANLDTAPRPRKPPLFLNTLPLM